jgi:hypothetical protein
MVANGPAIWGGCVTRRKHWAGSWYPAPAGPESCHGARRVWRTFCRPGTSYVSFTRVAVQVVSKPEICHGAEIKLCADERVRAQQPLQICLECRSKSKKCDKQLTHIVRVSKS